ncbi:MAG TPA: DUF742 domain-containing protein [Streptosporangiaceae bacterium]|jgi:hypothetical protein
MSGQGEYHDRPVRLYVITGGRARPSRNTIRPETLLVVADAGKQLPVSASTEERALLRMCHRLLSLVEAAVHLELPVSVVSVVASDLIDAGYLTMRGSSDGSPPGIAPAEPGEFAATRPDRKLLQEVLDGLRKLR